MFHTLDLHRMCRVVTRSRARRDGSDLHAGLGSGSKFHIHTNGTYGMSKGNHIFTVQDEEDFYDMRQILIWFNNYDETVVRMLSFLQLPTGRVPVRPTEFCGVTIRFGFKTL